MRHWRFLWIVPVIVIVAFFALVHFVVPGVVENSMNGVERPSGHQVSDKARVFHETLTVADLQANALLWKRDLVRRNERGHVDVPRMIEGNLALQIFTTVTKSPPDPDTAEISGVGDDITLLAIAQMWPIRTWSDLTERALFQAEKLHRFAERSEGKLVIIKTAPDLEELLRRRKDGDVVVGGLLGTKGSHALSGDLENVSRLYDAGFRVMSLQHLFDNLLGGSLHGSRKGGLTDFGRNAVRRMEEEGVIIDLSHSSEKVVRDTLDIVQRPIVISHTGTRSHCDSPSNLSDDLMVDIARRGGLIGIGFWPAAICDTSPDGIARAIQAAVDLVGEDHVALGSGFDGAVTTQIDASELVTVTDALLDLGMDKDTIRKVMGENQIRFLRTYLPRA